jgi:adenosylcobinamide-phosphate synthase
VEAARNQLARIVGRDTSKLSADKIRRAVLETLSENLSDGVIAPLFYYAIGGIPLMLTYKMVNTLDSMIGFKTDRFAQFGWSSAKLDDLLNFIPARLTALFMSLCTLSLRGLKFIFIFGKKHSSPNAGYPEAALAGILNCRLGGPSTYQGILIDKPYLGINKRMITSRDIYFSCLINVLVVIAFLVVILLFENRALL